MCFIPIYTYHVFQEIQAKCKIKCSNSINSNNINNINNNRILTVKPACLQSAVTTTNPMSRYQQQEIHCSQTCKCINNSLLYQLSKMAAAGKQQQIHCKKATTDH